MLEIKNLDVSIENTKILKNFNINIKEDEVHVIMGPNGIGKSTLSKVIMNDENYKIDSGEIIFLNESIKSLKTDEISRRGIFLAMQYPLEVEGITNADLLRTAISIKDEKNINLYQFVKEMEKTFDDLKMDKENIHKKVNEGYSGGERKKNEIIQLKMLKPKMIILDEIDSGVDVDSLKTICENINKYKEETKASILIITHYPKILEYIKPNYVHIMKDKKIIKTGDYSLALEIEKTGYKLLDE